MSVFYTEESRVGVCWLLSGLALGGCSTSVFYSYTISVVFLSSSVTDHGVRSLQSILWYLSLITGVFNGIVACMSRVLTYPERRVRVQVNMRLLTLAQLCVVIAFSYFSVLCFVSAFHFKVSG